MKAIRRETYDVAVVGGGSAGVAAAIGAARSGARTVLVERYGFLGGAATNALVLTYCGLYYRRERPELAVGGVAVDVLQRLKALGETIDPIFTGTRNWVVPIRPEPVKRALDDLLLEAKVDLRLHALVIDATTEAGRLTSITYADHAGQVEVRANAFVDASGEANLTALSGAALASSASDGQPQFASYCVRIGGVPPAATIDRARLRALFDSDEPSALKGLRRDGGIIIRPDQSDVIWWMGIDLSTDGLTSASLTAAECEGRRLAWAFIERLRRIPGCEAAQLIATGPQAGIRETRHPLAHAMIGADYAMAGGRAADGVARAAWPLENHREPGKPTMIGIGGEGFFDVPLAALQAKGLNNLWLSGRAIGADRDAFGSVRVMGAAFATGHAAGVAAARGVHGLVDVEGTRRDLLAQGAII